MFILLSKNGEHSLRYLAHEAIYRQVSSTLPWKHRRLRIQSRLRGMWALLRSYVAPLPPRPSPAPPQTVDAFKDSMISNKQAKSEYQNTSSRVPRKGITMGSDECPYTFTWEMVLTEPPWRKLRYIAGRNFCNLKIWKPFNTPLLCYTYELLQEDLGEFFPICFVYMYNFGRYLLSLLMICVNW